jgi:hypothetical protein
MPKDKYPHELGLLRKVIKGITLKPHSTGAVTEGSLSAHGLVRARIAPTGIIGIPRQISP